MPTVCPLTGRILGLQAYSQTQQVQVASKPL
jgi:hypothetical protein